MKNCHCMLQLFKPGTICDICEAYYLALKDDKLLTGIEDLPVIVCESYSCPICKPHQAKWIKNRNKQTTVKTSALYNFVTFTQVGAEQSNYDNLIKVITWLKKNKDIEQLEYAFELMQNGSPHLHAHWYSPIYYSKIEKQLKNMNKFYIKREQRNGSFQSCIEYMGKAETKSIELENKILSYNIEPRSKLVQEFYATQILQKNSSSSPSGTSL